MIGQRLLHYEIVEKLGEGGMGVVCKARDKHLDRFVAIKVLPPEKVSDPTRKARFVQEAKAASALNHPNIITIYDISSDNGVDFIAMEFVDGKTLDQLIPRKGMRLNEALKIAIQIADSLARAHSAGRIDGPFISSTHTDRQPQYSPDGSRIAFVSSRSGASEIWVSDADGSNARQVTSMAGTSGPTWSPDGQRIVFHSNAEGQFDIYVVPAGGGKPLRLPDHAATNSYAIWSRDGRWIYFDSTRSGVFEIWKTTASLGGAPRETVQVTRKGGYRPRESPDGKWLYYAKSFPVSGLWRMPVEGGEEAQVLEGVATYSYALADDGVYFMKASGLKWVLQFIDLATRRVKPIAATTKRLGSGLTVSPERRWALFSKMDQEGSDLMLLENFR